MAALYNYDAIYHKNSDFIWSQVGGEAVLLNVHSGAYFGLNEVGLSFWQNIDGSRSLSEIAELMLAEYEVSLEELMGDLAELARHMTANGLLLTEG